MVSASSLVARMKQLFCATQGVTGSQGGGNRRVDMVDQLVGRCGFPWPASFGIPRRGPNAHLLEAGGLQSLGKGAQRLLRIGCTRKGGAAQFLESFGFCYTLFAEVFIDRALRLGTAMLGVDQHPALRNAAVAGSAELIAITLHQRDHRLRVGCGRSFLHFGQGGRDAGDPLDARIGQLLEVLCAVQGAICHQVRKAMRGLQVRNVLGDDLSEVARVAGITTERLHQHWDASLVLPNHVEHHLVEIGPMIPVVAPGNMNDMLVGVLRTVVARIDMEARAIQMRKGWR